MTIRYFFAQHCLFDFTDLWCSYRETANRSCGSEK